MKQVNAKIKEPSPRDINDPQPAVSFPFPNTNYDIVAIAASLGGLKAIIEVLSNLPRDLPAAIVVVQHLAPQHRSLMAEILTRHTSLQVKQAHSGARVNPGTVYIAPPDHHLLINADGTLSLNQEKLEHFVRPSADVLFNSVANSYRERAIAIVLTGSGKDGVIGIQTIHDMGGIAIAQDEATSECFSMPQAAIGTGIVDHILPLSKVASTLISLVRS